MYSTRPTFTYQQQPHFTPSYGYHGQPTPYYDSRPPPRYHDYDPRSSRPSRHKRRATADGVYYSAPQQAYYYEEPAPKRSSSHRQREYVSNSDPRRSKSTRQAKVYPTDAYDEAHFRQADAYATFKPSKSPRKAYQPGGYADAREEPDSAYHRKYRVSPPPPEIPHERVYTSTYTYRTQEPVYQESKSRQRRSHSFSAQQQQQPPPPRPTTRGNPGNAPRHATEHDAKKAGIPSGFSLKHWDPTEEPILLMGSVFDANSLGKWIYDWTVAYHGAGTPLTEVAGELWLLLIQLAGKIKRAEDKVKRVRDSEDRETIEDFLEAGERLWQRFSKLLKLCEQYMLKKAKRDSRSGKKVHVGKDGGLRFVKCIFGRDHELERTEKITTGIRLWSMRFDANCDDILRRTY